MLRPWPPPGHSARDSCLLNGLPWRSEELLDMNPKDKNLEAYALRRLWASPLKVGQKEKPKEEPPKIEKVLKAKE